MDIQGLKDKILQLAIQGKLVDQDKNDEPASALLNRIKEERDKLVKEGKIRKPKKLPPIEEEEKYFGIPEGWEWVRLGEVAQFINGDRGKNYPSKKELVESGIPFINAGHLNNSEIELVNMNYITDEKFESLSSGKIQIKDIIYCLRGTLGKCSINKKIEKGAIASSLVIIRNYVDIYEKYIYYYLVSPLSKYMIKKYDNGTAQPNLSAESVRQYSLPLPPLTEQKRIVEKVDMIMEMLNELQKELGTAQILALSGGFSAGDEPDGSGKFIANVLRENRIAQAVISLLEERNGLVLGICNGFQALIKTGLVPYGKILAPSEDMPTLTFNRIGRHISRVVNTRMVSAISPWAQHQSVVQSQTHLVPISHGEGRIIIDKDFAKKLFENGQIFTQYVDENGNPVMTEPTNPNGSMFAIEGMTSPDGRVLGKMGHNERTIGTEHLGASNELIKNIQGNKCQNIFAAGVRYFD